MEERTDWSVQIQGISEKEHQCCLITGKESFFFCASRGVVVFKGYATEKN